MTVDLSKGWWAKCEGGKLDGLEWPVEDDGSPARFDPSFPVVPVLWEYREGGSEYYRPSGDRTKDGRVIFRIAPMPAHALPAFDENNLAPLVARLS